MWQKNSRKGRGGRGLRRRLRPGRQRDASLGRRGSWGRTKHREHTKLTLGTVPSHGDATRTQSSRPPCSGPLLATGDQRASELVELSPIPTLARHKNYVEALWELGLVLISEDSLTGADSVPQGLFIPQTGNSNDQMKTVKHISQPPCGTEKGEAKHKRHQ